MSVPPLAARPVPAVEWPTLALAAAIHGAWVTLCVFHAALPWWGFAAAAAIVSAWFGSLQHEIIHGHPTSRRRVNALLAAPPLWLWLPFARYRDSHLAHHDDARLTDPLDDPESRYWTRAAWDALGPVGRALHAAQATLLGRVTLGPAWTIALFVHAEAAAVRAGDREARRAWLIHAALLVPHGAFVFAVCGVPIWLYALGFVQGGLALTLIRSFAEHRAAQDVARRTAVVENSALLGPLFLFNNLHAAHHRWPRVPWYRLPALYRAERESLLAANGGLVYAGYGEVARRFLFRHHDTPVHPTGRAHDHDGRASRAAHD